jgi:acetylornithine deacetylase/succinyl-diaminopimelate desuccinylase-like protein
MEANNVVLMSSQEISAVFKAVEQDKQRLMDDLRELIAVPSVSAKNQGITEAAELLKTMLERDGFKVSLLETDTGRPAVFGVKEGAGKPILLYNHYDVQPPEPLEEWETQPFKLVERDGRLYGRGVADNKGEIAARLAAVRVAERTYGRLPLTVKWLIEGEEEVGSLSIGELVLKHRELFSDCFGCLWEGGDVVDGVPNFYLGVKGMLYVELSVKTAQADAHSMYAPVLENAAEKLVKIVAGLRDARGRVTLPGFYRDVKKPTRMERKMLASAKIDAGKFAEALGVNKLAVGKGRVVEKLVYSPTCNIAGIYSGYTGPGSKTITPSKAGVKIDFRLVPNQDPDKILKSLKKNLRGVEVIVHSKSYPARISPKSAVVRAAVLAAEKVYGVKPVIYPNMFGTGPMAHFTRAGIPSAMLTALSHPGSRLHAPNENIFVTDFVKSVAHHALLFKEVGVQA